MISSLLLLTLASASLAIPADPAWAEQDAAWAKQDAAQVSYGPWVEDETYRAPKEIASPTSLLSKVSSFWTWDR